MLGVELFSVGLVDAHAENVVHSDGHASVFQDDGGGLDLAPTWSDRTDEVYFASNRGLRLSLFSMSLTYQKTKPIPDSGRVVVFQPTGATEAYLARGDRALLYRSADGGETQLGSLLHHHSFAVYHCGIVFQDAGGGVRRWPRVGSTQELFRVDRPWQWLAVTDDGSRVIYSQLESAEIDLSRTNSP